MNKSARTTLGNKIRQLRIRRGFSQNGLAEKAGISTRTVQRIEGNEVRPYQDTLSRLAAALGVPVEEISLTEEKPVSPDRRIILFHLSPLMGFLAPLAQIWAPFFYWLLYRADHGEMDRHVGDIILFHSITTVLLASGLLLIYLSLSIGYVIAGATLLFCTSATVWNAYQLSTEGTYSYSLGLSRNV